MRDHVRTSVDLSVLCGATTLIPGVPFEKAFDYSKLGSLHWMPFEQALRDITIGRKEVARPFDDELIEKHRARTPFSCVML